VRSTSATPPKHAAARQGSIDRPRLSPARKLEVIGLLAGLLAGLGVALIWVTAGTPAHAPIPVTVTQPSSPVHVRAATAPDPAALDQEWAAYSNRSTCADWAGGDGISAIRLNSGQVAWFFSDTFLGPASPTTGFSRGQGFVHNLVVVQTTEGKDSTFVTMAGGGACDGPGNASGKSPGSVVGPPLAPGAPTDRYWDADGIEVGGTVVKFYNRYLPGGPPPFVPKGTVMATFSVSGLGSAGGGSPYGLVAKPGLIPLPSYVPSDGGTPIVWGAALVRAGNTVYVYGTQSANPSAPERQLYLARVPATQLTRFSAWRFYSADGRWAAGQSNAQPVQPSGTGPSVSSGFSVVEIASRYWLIQANPQPGSNDIDAYPAATPWGPFDAAAGITLYRDANIGLDAAHEYRIMYEARAEAALSSGNTLVISYNVNSEAVTTGCKTMGMFTNAMVQPKFVAVPMSVFAPGAAGRFPVTIGAANYPRIVQRDPAQWFNAFSYRDGCPPVPGLASVRARTRAGAVALTWPDDGLGVHYHVYLTGPGENGGRVASTFSDSATIAGLRPGQYTATVKPVNVRDTAGQAASVLFTFP
jgi:hypothetical protein